MEYMEKRQFIKDLSVGAEIDGVFLLGLAQQGQARNGPYWRLELRDASGALEAKIWSPQSQAHPDLSAGSLVEVRGRVTSYRDRPEIAVEQLKVLGEAEAAGLDLADFMPASARNPAEMLGELTVLLKENLAHPPLRKLALAVLKDEEIAKALPGAAAAKSMHHAYAGGFLEHTLSVCRLCLALADLYPQLDRQILLAGALCHDLGKLRELSSGLNVDYTTEGRLIGHISIGLERLEPLIRKSGLEPDLADHLRHLILSHHGQREFGAPVLPATAEAFALHYADNLDAKLNQTAGALGRLEGEGPGWSAYVPGLDRFLYRAPHAPQAGPERGRGKTTAQERQCSLLSKA